MKNRLLLIIAAVVVPGLQARVGNLPEGEPARKSDWVFTLLPKAFQKNPRVDFNILTEMTAEGRKRGEPTAANPAYCIAHLAPAENHGFSDTNMSSHGPAPAEVERLVARALRERNYLAAPKDGPAPTVAFLVHWGAFSSPALKGEDFSEFVDLEQQGSLEQDADQIHLRSVRPKAYEYSSTLDLLSLVLADKTKIAAFIDRARLIGGKVFARDVSRALSAEVAMRRNVRLGVSPIRDAAETFPLMQSQSPFAIFMRRDVETEEMVEELFSDSFFVIISAIDYDSLTRRQPVLLWRTKMSLNAIGVAPRETLPQLIVAGAAYLAKETPRVSVTRRLRRGGSVDFGEPEIQEYMDTTRSPGASGSKPR